MYILVCVIFLFFLYYSIKNFVSLMVISEVLNEVHLPLKPPEFSDEMGQSLYDLHIRGKLKAIGLGAPS